MYYFFQSSRTKIFICVSAIVSFPASVVPAMMVTPPTVAPMQIVVSSTSPNLGRR